MTSFRPMMIATVGSRGLLMMMTQVMMILWTTQSRKCMRSWSKCLLSTLYVSTRLREVPIG
jgi:hypothetical protein